MVQRPEELFVSLLRRHALLRRHLWRDTTALGGPAPLLAVPRKSIGTREKVATSVTNVDHEGMCLREITVTFIFLKVLELLIRAKSAFYLLEGPTCKVGIRSLEKRSLPLLEFAGDLEKFVCLFLLVLLCLVADVMRCFLTDTPLGQSRLPIR